MTELSMNASTRRALVMDDQEMLREVAADMLEELGYQVVQAEDGAEAVEIYAAALDQGQGFELVMMDLTVPHGMGGAESARRIVELDDKARIIVCSGHSADAVISQYRDYGFSGVICKPYHFDELKQVVQTVTTRQAD